MARIIQENGTKAAEQTHDTLTFQANGADRIDLPSPDLIADAKITREGDNLILETPNGETAVIEGYFSADPAPILYSPDGSALTPNLVQSFAHSPMQFAANETTSDQSPVGAVEEVKGHATVTRADGTVELVVRGAGRELHRARLDATTPSTEVRVSLPPGALEIELLAADGSAVGDVVRLERAVLIERPPA